MTLLISLSVLAAIAIISIFFNFVPMVSAEVPGELPRDSSGLPSVGIFVAAISASIILTMALVGFTTRRTHVKSLPQAIEFRDLRSLVIRDPSSQEGQDLAYVNNLSTVSEATSASSALGILVTEVAEGVRPEVIASTFLPHLVKRSEGEALYKLIADSLQSVQQASQAKPGTEESRSGIGLLVALKDKVYIGTSGSVVALTISGGKFSVISGGQDGVHEHQLIKGQIIALGSREFAEKDLQDFLSPILGEFQDVLSSLMGESYELDAIRSALQQRTSDYPKMSLILLT